MKHILALLLMLAPVSAWAQTFQPLTAFTAPGALSVVVGTPQFATATVHVEGTGAGMTFAAQGVTSSGALVTLPMYAAGSPATSPITSASANGDWVVSVAGYTKFQWSLTAISGGTASASIATSNQPAVVYAPAGGGALPTGASTAANQNSTPAGTTATNAQGVQGVTGGVALPVSGTVNAAPSVIAPVSSTAVEGSHVFKSSAGTLYSFTVTNPTTAGYFMLFDATSAPADGAVTPKYCLPVNANQAIGMSATPVAVSFATGIVGVFSTTGCFTKTVSATANMSALVQ